MYIKHTHTHIRFTALFLGPPGWASARRELLYFMVQGKINRGRHTDHPAGCHSSRTNQCPPPPSPHFLQAGCPSCPPTNSVKALKASKIYTQEQVKVTNQCGGKCRPDNWRNPCILQMKLQLVHFSPIPTSCAAHCNCTVNISNYTKTPYKRHTPTFRAAHAHL